MALRDQPYIPLYVQDFLTDEKLNECSPASQGIYIKIMCLMHKSKEYGMILLKQKYKQSSNTCLNFACQLSNHLTFTKSDIEKALKELIEEDVLQLETDKILQKRMIKDNDISLKRSNAGKKGGGNPNFVSGFVKTKVQTNTENENEIEAVIKYLNDKANKKFSYKTDNSKKLIIARLKDYSFEDMKLVIDKKCDDWLNDIKMNKYLRPETLFNKTKFENYLNENTKQEADIINNFNEESFNRTFRIEIENLAAGRHKSAKDVLKIFHGKAREYAQEKLKDLGYTI